MGLKLSANFDAVKKNSVTVQHDWNKMQNMFYLIIYMYKKNVTVQVSKGKKNRILNLFYLICKKNHEFCRLIKIFWQFAGSPFVKVPS